MERLIRIMLVPALILSAACKREPEHVTVQHILVAFKGSIPKESVTRTQDEARELAFDLFERAKSGADFDALVKEFTDDQYPGVYRMANFHVDPDAEEGEFPRARMVKAFGDVSFELPVNGIGMAAYHPRDCKYGWHIIKRIQ